MQTARMSKFEVNQDLWGTQIALQMDLDIFKEEQAREDFANDFWDEEAELELECLEEISSDDRFSEEDEVFL